jgi:hypothetical protein
MNSNNYTPQLLGVINKLLGNGVYFRTVKGQLQIVKKSEKRKRKRSAKQLQSQLKFRGAAMYARAQISIPEFKALYQTGITEKKTTAYQVALTDYMTPPQVKFIDPSYHGVVGESIIIEAVDDFSVTKVEVMIEDGDGTIIEKGEAKVVDSKAHLWGYKVNVANPNVVGTRISAYAYDKPYNRGQAMFIVGVDEIGQRSIDV